jgi:hypothetical protein
VPHAHKGLASGLDMGSYSSQLFELLSVQVRPPLGGVCVCVWRGGGGGGRRGCEARADADLLLDLEGGLA